MKIYEIDKEYISYLHSFENKVEKSTAEHYRFSRKYLGIVLTVNNFKYFAPLSSTKTHKDYFPSGEIRPSVVPLIRITKSNKDGSISLLGKIQLNNMIPIFNDNLVKLYDLNKEEDIKYKNMVFNQINFINKNVKLITKNANILYNNKIKNLDIGYVKNTVDFTLLEEKALEYDNYIKENSENEKKKEDVSPKNENAKGEKETFVTENKENEKLEPWSKSDLEKNPWDKSEDNPWDKSNSIDDEDMDNPWAEKLQSDKENENSLDNELELD